MRVRIGDICTTFSGFTPAAADLFQAGKYPYFKVAEMNREANLRVMTETDSYVRESRKFFPKGAIVFPKNGAAIATNKKRILGQDSIVDLNTGGVKANEDIVDTNYLYYLFQNIDFSQFMRRGAVPTLDLKSILALEIELPTIPDQHRIVKELDLLSGIVEKKNAQLKTLDDLAMSVFAETFDCDVHNWNEKPLVNCVNKVKYTTKLQTKDFLKNGKFPIISQEEEFISGYWNSPEDLFRVKKPVVIFGDHTRVLKYIDFDFVLGADGVRILEPIDELNSQYLYYFLRSNPVENLGYSRHFKLLKEKMVVIPPMSMQKVFAEKVKSINKQKIVIGSSLRVATELLNSRIDTYFNV